MVFLSFLAASVVQGPSQASFDWIKADLTCTAIACADMDGDGRDDVLATFSDGRLLVSYSLPGRKADEWRTLCKHVPQNTVAIALVKTDRRSLMEFLLATPTQLFSWLRAPSDSDPRDESWKLKGERRSKDSEDVPLRVAEAVAADGLFWVHTPEGEWWRLRTAGSFFDGPYPDPRPSLLPVSPPLDESKPEPAKARWTTWGDLDGDGERDSIAVFPVGRSPDEHLVVRVTFAGKPKK
jgi:hypothetical protein